jgi:chromate transporter
LFWSFFKIGGLTFGGGYAMIPIMQQEIIRNRRWIGTEEFVELLALAQTSPGPISVNTAVFVGYKTRGYVGAVTALLGTVLPAFGVILVIAAFFADYSRYPLVESAFKGMRPAVVALIAAPVYNMLKGMGWSRIALALIVAVAVGFLALSPIYFLIAGAVGGILWSLLRKDKPTDPQDPA